MMQVATRFMKCRSWLVKITVPCRPGCLGERLDGIHVQVVARFVEHQHVVIAEQEPRQAESGTTAFYDEELALRERWGSPPFGRLVKLTVALPERDAAEREALAMADRLRALAAEPA